MKTVRLTLALIALIGGRSLAAAENPPAPGFDLAGSDPQAIALADRTMERMGGRENWDSTRYLTWRFFGGRLHVWDKWTGRLRFEEKGSIVLMNIHTRQGKAWIDGVEVTDPDTLAAKLKRGYEAWINDSYWLAMPYKLKDSGVTLKYKGEGKTEDGRAADVLTLTFKGVGVTPQNKYDIWIDRESGLVTQWAFYPQASDTEPRFVGPWTGWKQYGSIWLSDGRGRSAHSDIAVFADLPDAIFTSPQPVDVMSLVAK